MGKKTRWGFITLVILLIVSAVIFLFIIWLPPSSTNPDRYSFVQTFVLTLTFIVLVIYTEATYRMQQDIKRQADAADKTATAIIEQNEHLRLSVAADWMRKLDDQFDGKELTNFRCFASDYLLTLRDDPQNDKLELRRNTGLKALESIWDFFDTMGLLLHRGILDEELTYSTFFHWVNGYYKASSKQLEEMRIKRKDQRWKDFILLYNRLLDLEKKNPDSQDLNFNNDVTTKFLTDEQTENWRPPDLMPLTPPYS